MSKIIFIILFYNFMIEHVHIHVFLEAVNFEIVK